MTTTKKQIQTMDKYIITFPKDTQIILLKTETKNKRSSTTKPKRQKAIESQHSN